MASIIAHHRAPSRLVERLPEASGAGESMAAPLDYPYTGLPRRRAGIGRGSESRSRVTSSAVQPRRPLPLGQREAPSSRQSAPRAALAFVEIQHYELAQLLLVQSRHVVAAPAGSCSVSQSGGPR